MRDLLFHNIRLIDPATRLDQIGALLVRDGRIVDLARHSAGQTGPR